MIPFFTAFVIQALSLGPADADAITHVEMLGLRASLLEPTDETSWPGDGEESGWSSYDGLAGPGPFTDLEIRPFAICDLWRFAPQSSVELMCTTEATSMSCVHFEGGAPATEIKTLFSPRWRN